MTRSMEKTTSRRWLRWGLAVLTVSAGAATLAVGPAYAGASGASGAYGNQATHRCLDSDDSGNVYTNPCDYTNLHQLWDEYVTPLGGIAVRNQATGRCLDSNLDGDIYTSGCDGLNPYQQWEIIGDGPIFLRDTKTNRCADSNLDGDAYTSGCDGNNPHQRWV